MSVETLALKLVQRGLTFEEAQKFAERFVDWYFGNFKTLAAWIDRLMIELRDNNFAVASNMQRNHIQPHLTRRPLHRYVVSPFGRELLIPLNTPRTELRRLCANYPTQSAAGDITNIAACRVDRELREAKCESKLVLAIHDAIYVDTPNDEKEFVKDVIRRNMLRSDEYSWMQCELATEIVIGPTLGDLAPETVSAAA